MGTKKNEAQTLGDEEGSYLTQVKLTYKGRRQLVHFQQQKKIRLTKKSTFYGIVRN